MRELPDGTLEVSEGETVTVTVTARNHPFLAAFSDLKHRQWQNIRYESERSQVREVNFTNGFPPDDRFVVTYDFIQDDGETPTGASYLERVEGDMGSYFRESTIESPAKRRVRFRKQQ
ncbi:MAG TPA: hypothetical protein VLU25_14830 [Acidobacteriota bacterium]|nr:hypothetical protein [Acidobacteriota bacterium]